MTAGPRGWLRGSSLAGLARALAAYPAILAYLFAYERLVALRLGLRGGAPPWKGENRPVRTRPARSGRRS